MSGGRCWEAGVGGQVSGPGRRNLRSPRSHGNRGEPASAGGAHLASAHQGAFSVFVLFPSWEDLAGSI